MINFGEPESTPTEPTPTNSSSNTFPINVTEGPNQPLSFGEKITAEIQSLQAALSQVPLGLPQKSQLSFGLPTLTDFTSKLQSLSTPQTICITVGGPNSDLSSIFNQINNIITLVPKPNLPSLSLPQLPELSLPSLSQFVPALNITPKLPITLNVGQVLAQIQLNCEQFAIDALNSLDPTERLEQLLQEFSKLCGLLQFTQLQSVISQIEQAKADLVNNVISSIPDAASQIQKLIEVATDAINANAYDIVNQAANLINQIKFNSLISYVMSINPETAISQLEAEIQQQAQLQNFSAIPQLLNAINVVQSSLQSTINSVFSAPQLEANQLQSEINNLLNVKNYTQIGNLITSFTSAQDAIINQLAQLDPATALQKGTALLQNALQTLNLAQFNQIMNALSQSICNNGKSLLPSVPSVPQINPSSIPSFL